MNILIFCTRIFSLIVSPDFSTHNGISPLKKKWPDECVYLESRKNDPRKNGPRKNDPRKNGPRKNDPRKMIPGKNGPRKTDPQEK